MRTVKFHYIKAPSHQEVRVDGAIGGPLPSGIGLSMSVFSERAPIPRSVSNEVSDSNTLGREIEDTRDARDGIVRIVQSTLYMDERQARQIHKWLGDQIELLNKINTEIKK